MITLGREMSGEEKDMRIEGVEQCSVCYHAKWRGESCRRYRSHRGEIKARKEWLKNRK